MDKKKYNFVYRTTLLDTGEFYIGKHSTNNLNDGYYGSGDYIKHKVKSRFRKGIPYNEIYKLDILEFADTEKQAFELEAKYLTEQVVNDPLCLNFQTGGEGGYTQSQKSIQQRVQKTKNRKRTNKQKQNISIGTKLAFQQPATKERLRLLYLSRKGKSPSKETCDKLSDICKKSWGNDKIRNKRIKSQKVSAHNRKYTQDGLQKISNARKEYYATHPEAKQNISIQFSGRKWITNGIDEHFIHIEDLEKFPDYVFGRLKSFNKK